MIINLLILLLYALIALLVLQLVFFIVEKFLPIPQPVRQLIYAIVGVLFIIQIAQLFLGGTPLLYFPRR